MTRANLLARCARVALTLTVVLQACGCGTLVQRAAVRGLAAALAAPGAADVFASDNDPDLVREALPFALKTYDLMSARAPRDADLRAAAAAAYVQFANAFVEREALRTTGTDFAASERARRRAATLYLRGRDHGLAGLAARYRGFTAALRADPTGAVTRLRRRDVPLAFWTGAGWLAALSADPSQMARLAERPAAEALLRRALELDEAYQAGLIHEVFIRVEGTRSEAMGGDPARARRHFERAVELSRGRRAGPYVALAETVAVRQQDPELFRELLQKAQAVDPEAVPAWRLVNLLAQEKARWLLEHGEDFFLEWEAPPGPAGASVPPSDPARRPAEEDARLDDE